MDNELLNRFFKGECSWEEAQQVSLWINSNKGKGELFEGFDSFDPTSYDKVPLNSEKLLMTTKRKVATEEVIQSLLEEEEKPTIQLTSSQGHQAIRKWMRYAAAVLLAAMSSLFVYVLMDAEAHKENLVADAGWITKKTESGQKLTIHFSDGSMVMLNANSSVTYPKDFEANRRLVKMSGEVFFEVAKDPSRPFIAETPQLQTIALGTSFNIKAYPGQLEEVTLLTGKVRVQATDNNNNNQILIPGQRITRDNSDLVKSEIDLATQALWKEGIIYFQNTAFEKGVSTLERWYGVEIEVLNRPDKDLKFTGRFNNDYLSNVLESLSYTMKFKYSINEKKVTIDFNSLPMTK